MTNLQDYIKDGADASARAVLCLLQGIFGIEKSPKDEWDKYEAEPKIARWENCREQGYVISLKNKDYSKQLNIAFFEHRNSDSIHSVRWEQITLNSPTIDTAEFGNVYKSKYDTSYSVDYNGHYEMAEWINRELNDFWTTNLKQ